MTALVYKLFLTVVSIRHFFLMNRPSVFWYFRKREEFDTESRDAHEICKKQSFW